MEDRIKRMELAKQARCEGEADAITWYNFEPGAADCSNCGHAFPPESIAAEGKDVWCAEWTGNKSVMYFCKAWKHSNDIAAFIAPPWAKPYTKERIT